MLILDSKTKEMGVGQRSPTPSQVSQTPSGVDSSHSGSCREGLILNPLTQKSRETLLTDVGIFAQEKGLGNQLSILERGAIREQLSLGTHNVQFPHARLGKVAQSPAEFDSLDGLTDLDKIALRDENERRWRHPPPLYWTIILCSIAAITQ